MVVLHVITDGVELKHELDPNVLSLLGLSEDLYVHVETREVDLDTDAVNLVEVSVGVVK